MLCPNCGNQIPDNSKWCPNCGQGTKKVQLIRVCQLPVRYSQIILLSNPTIRPSNLYIPHNLHSSQLMMNLVLV